MHSVVTHLVLGWYAKHWKK